MTTQRSVDDQRISDYIHATHELQKGNYEISVPTQPRDEIGRLGQALLELARQLERRRRELETLNHLTMQINMGLLLDETLEGVYNNFREVIPYNRIGFAFLEHDNSLVRAYWSKSDGGEIHLKNGYSAPLAGSSLQPIIETGQPRIINDLLDYLKQRPESRSTRLIVKEGIRSSLTCPLIANGVPVGFIFFSSSAPNTYANAHIEIFQQIAGLLAVIMEKGRLIADLAEQKSAVERQNEELRRLNEVKNSFLGIAAHDLRSPLSSAFMAANLLADSSVGLSDEERAVIVKEIKEQTGYMMELLNNLLDVTHIESGKFSIVPTPINFGVFVQEVVQRQQRVAEAKSIRIVIECPPAPGSQIVADALRLRQVLDNLLSNAIKFSPPDSTVRVSVEPLPGVWRVTVQDQGPGIKPEEQSRLFQEFSQLSARPTKGEKSTGLGLAITRRVVEAHGGQIGVESPPGQGAAFWFTIPRAG
ncbi:MAG: GAF domain-containing protein [Chloroflexi bacterium]|nr:GAF domain-containing protein [Chloroflexota bacterium]